MDKKVWTKDEIKAMLLKSQNAVEKGLVAIYNRQTQVEKMMEATRYNNSVGFSAAHCRRGSYYARWINSGKRLSGKHLEKGREIILHYVGQLTKISNGEIA